MVEEDAIGGKNIVSFTVIDHHPISVEFGHSVGTAGVEGSLFVLGWHG